MTGHMIVGKCHYIIWSHHPIIHTLGPCLIRNPTWHCHIMTQISERTPGPPLTSISIILCQNLFSLFICQSLTPLSCILRKQWSLQLHMTVPTLDVIHSESGEIVGWMEEREIVQRDSVVMVDGWGKLTRSCWIFQISDHVLLFSLEIYWLPRQSPNRPTQLQPSICAPHGIQLILRHLFDSCVFYLYL